VFTPTRSPTDRLGTPHAVFSRTDLSSSVTDAAPSTRSFGRAPVVAIPGYSRPLIRVEEFERFLEEHTYRGDRVRPSSTVVG